MMMNEMLTILLLLHVLGDFFLQRQKDIDERFVRTEAFFFHLTIHVILGLISIAVFFFNTEFMILIGLHYAMHLIIDGVIIGIQQLRKMSQGLVYALDQGLHLFAIFIGVYLIEVYDFIDPTFITHLEPTAWRLLTLVTGFLFLLKPTNYTFKTYFLKYKPKDTEEDIPNAGGHIGSIERLVMMILLIMSAEIALGIVLTAKTLTRFDKINTDKPFAQYYLLGTLFSILAALLVYGLVFGWQFMIL
jgi:hypothetical protein